MKYPVKRHMMYNGEISTDTYEYRGEILRRNDSTPAGYYGRWEVWPNLHRDDTRARCIAWVDARIAAKELAKKESAE